MEEHCLVAGDFGAFAKITTTKAARSTFGVIQLPTGGGRNPETPKLE